MVNVFQLSPGFLACKEEITVNYNHSELSFHQGGSHNTCSVLHSTYTLNMEHCEPSEV